MSKDDPSAPPRRDFLNLAIASSAGALAVAMGYPVLRYVDPGGRRSAGPTAAGKLGELPVSTAKTVLVGDRPVLLLRGADGEIRAFSAICTHLQCIVRYDAERRQIVCPCHGGVFSADGRPVSGPPPRKLDELTVTLDGETILVSEEP